MAREPGTLSDFGEAAQKEWDALVAGYFSGNDSPHLLAEPDDRTPDDVTVDWGAFPVRIERCLGSRRNASRLLDWRTTQGDIGRAQLQEEYFEWRVVRDDTDAIRRVEMTTEFPEYWLTLAAHHPLTVVELVRRFSGDATVAPSALFGGADPATLEPAERKAAFEDAMLPRGGKAPWSPYNNGADAICFMSQGANTLSALVALVAAAAFPYVAEGSEEPLTGSQAIASGTQAAVPCRNSDPTVVEATIGLAAQGRLFALDDPIGVYILGVNHDQLEQPDGSDVPAEWFQFQRGSRPPEGKERSQRLVLEIPPEVELAVSDLVDRDTGERIAHGGQIAALVQLGVHVRLSAERPVEPTLRAVAAPEVTPCDQDPGCAEVRTAFDEFEQLGRNLLERTPTEIALRSGTVRG
jgi:hypothetical protein